MQAKRLVVKQKLTYRYDQYVPLDREQYRAYLLDVRESDLGIYSYLTEEDINWLHARWPQEYALDPEVDEQPSLWMLEHLKDVRPECDWRVAANCWKAMTLLDINRDVLHQAVYEETLSLYREALLDYLFDK